MDEILTIQEEHAWAANLFQQHEDDIVELKKIINRQRELIAKTVQTLPSSALVAVCNATFISTGKDTIAWSAGTLTLSDGRTQSFDAGTLTLLTGNSFYAYICLDWGNATLHPVYSASDVAQENRFLLAIADSYGIQADDNQYAYVHSNFPNVPHVHVNSSFVSANAIITAKIKDDAVTTAKILNSNVTYAKVQNVSAPNKILGRVSAGAGVVEELTGANVAGMIDHADLTNVTTSQHHVRYADAEALAAAWANINTKNLNNLLVNGSFEIGDPPTRWVLQGANATLSRSNEQAKIGTYSAKLTRVGATCYCYQNITPFAHLKGRQVTLGCWVYATVASRARIQIWDGVAAYQSSFHTGSSTLEWLTVTATINANATGLQPSGLIQDGDTDAYFDGAILVEGNSCPAFYPDTLFPLTLTFGDNLTISGGVIAVTNSFHNVDTEGAAATDDLDTINGGFPGYFLVISPLNTARTIVVKHGTGNINLEGSTDFVMDDNWKAITLMYHQSVWFEVSRSSQNDQTQFVKHSLADNANDFLVASGADAFVKKTLAETKTILGMGLMANIATGSYTGTGVEQAIAHGLGIVPKLIVVYGGSAGAGGILGALLAFSGEAGYNYILEDYTDNSLMTGTFSVTAPTATNFYVGGYANTNTYPYNWAAFT